MPYLACSEFLHCSDTGFIRPKLSCNPTGLKHSSNSYDIVERLHCLYTSEVHRDSATWSQGRCDRGEGQNQPCSRLPS